MAAVNKPLQKDPSFWIVAVVLVGAAVASQLYFGIPWFAQRLEQSRLAPRIMPLSPEVSTPVPDAGNAASAKQANSTSAP